MALGLWEQAAVGTAVGLLPGFFLLIWIASPFGPGLWKLSPLVSRLIFTVSQFIRDKGLFVHRKGGEYEHGTFVPESAGGPAVQVDGERIPVDPDNITWGLFGKKPMGLTWEPGTELHERIKTGSDAVPDGGGYAVNMAAAHRYLERSNEDDAISRTEEHAKAVYGGGSSRIPDKYMALLIILMLILGATTSFLALTLQ